MYLRGFHVRKRPGGHMLTTAELLAQAKAAQGIPSNYRLSRVLDVPEKTVQRWNTGKSRPDDEHAARLALMAGIDPGVAIASINAERDPTGPMHSVWVGIAQRLERAGVSAAVLALGVTFTGGPDAGAMASQPAPAQVIAPGLYIMSTARRALRRAARWLSSRTSIDSPALILA